MGVCDAACTDNPADLSSIQGWYTSYCAEAGAGDQEKTAAPTATGSKLDNHYQWVIFLVIMVVAIVGIWVGACVWRRRYLRKKDRQYALGTNLARATESGRVLPNSSSAGSIHVPAAGMFDPAPITSAGVYGEKSSRGKKKWLSRS
ncbi:hypothetical protein N0V88_004346 [Collariella sp. IMI 366227]|nr:hypothetical protein N0V88_004346 [Collariella sp. IMI 366227]